MAQELNVETGRGVLLDGVLFGAPGGSDTVVIAITGIHGNFYSNPFYVNFGETLNSGGIDFAYAQTCDAFGQIPTMNVKTGERVVIGSQTEDFGDAVEDVGAYDNFTKGDPAAFLENINSHMPTAADNELVFIERTGHTYQMKEQEVADKLLEVASRWRKGE